jgi:hypothetical protein
MKKLLPLWFTAVVFTLLSVGLAYEQRPTITSFSPTSGNIGTSVTITGTNFNATANQISMSTRDLDGDGKPNFSVANSGLATDSVFRNTSTNGIINIFQELPKFSIK